MAMLLVAACGEERVRPEAPTCEPWEGELATVIAARCTTCHGGDQAAGGYHLTSYLEALGTGSDTTANVIAGDQGSAILTVLSDETHAGVRDLRPRLESWVVACQAAVRRSAIHPGGILNPADPSFHGQLVAGVGWDLRACTTCHGADFAGGSTGATCTTCHEGGPTACATCHSRPEGGAHVTHVARMSCAECHVVPDRWDAPGHILGDAPPAEVTFGARAALDFEGRRTAPPSWDGTRCSSVYCHGAVFSDGAATNPTPRWQGDTVTCGSCHGTPPSDHGTASTCVSCHPRATAENHNDGQVQLGRDDGPLCARCHGGGDDPAPPLSVQGLSFTTALPVGAHQSHLQARHQLAAPVACASCHLVPGTLTAAGHVDTELPAEVVTTAGWDRQSATCANGCHGDARPVWNRVDVGEASCGTCHGLPPDGHAPATINDCATCHPRTVDAFGNILWTNEGSEHLDGNVD
jgi:predicted CxxxxCH...CXXCH cytochrome family protein